MIQTCGCTQHGASIDQAFNQCPLNVEIMGEKMENLIRGLPGRKAAGCGKNRALRGSLKDKISQGWREGKSWKEVASVVVSASHQEVHVGG